MAEPSGPHRMKSLFFLEKEIEMLREKCPRLGFVRDGDWQNLNGSWQFSLDDDSVAMAKNWPLEGAAGRPNTTD